MSQYVWQPKVQTLQQKLEELRKRVGVSEQPEPQTSWWQQPKVWGEEKAMPWVGEQISKVPILPKALEKIAPAFEFIHEKLEKPFAAIITSPFSPNLPWRSGESWVEHEKREYATWKAPTYIKGVAEFAMPLWWLPYVGWAAKGAKALGVGNKMMRAAAALPKAGKVVLPADKVLDDVIFRPDMFKRFASWAENKPVVGGVVRAIGGPSAFVRAPLEGELPIEVAKRALIKRAVISDMKYGVRGLLAPRLQVISDDPIKLLNIADDGLIRGVAVKDGSSAYLSDVIEGFARNPENYRFATKEAENYVKETVKIINEVRELAVKEGVKVPKEFTFHRMVRGIFPEGDKAVMEASEFGSKFEMGRHLKTMQEGATRTVRRVQYDNNPLNSVNATIDHYIKGIAAKRFNDEVGKLGKTAVEKFALQFPDEAQKIADLSAKALAAQYAGKAISSIITRKGTTLPPATFAKIERSLPEIATQLDEVFKFTPAEVDTVISKMGREVWREAKIQPKEFKVLLAQFNETPGRILMRELDDTIRSLNISNKTAVTAIENAYKGAYRTLSSTQKDLFKALKKQADDILASTKDELAPLNQARREFLRPYREGKQILGEFEKVFTKHRAFANRIFPREVVELVEPALHQQGNQWLRNMSTISGTGRLLIAALDFSAPFIQGLAVFGRNPVAWAKGVIRQFEFFAKPTNVYKYMEQPAIKALHAEMVAHGASLSTFEFFEAMKPLQRVTGKVGAKVIGQTYGRAEAAFTGFGMVARDNMWMALRRKALRPDGALDEVIARDLIRSIDRMTGVMSMEAIGFGRTQRDIESAFVFFAPRYTRAGLAYVGDILKGGIAGAEARKSLGSMMAAGAAMYYGVCKVTGQRPNFDINSAQFMTVKIGDDHVGVGGILYGLGRFAANVAATATGDEPLDLVRLSRFDNPFLKFMFQRTSPLTGMAFGAAIEQKNYFGEPLESPADWGKFMAEKVLPIAMQRAILEPEHRQPAVFASEIMGGRTFPKSDWELQEEAQDRIALQRFGMPYDELDLLQKKEVDKTPEVTVYQEEIDKRTSQMGKALSVQFLERRRELDDARFMHKQSVEQLQKAYDAGVITGYDFKEGVKSANEGYGATYLHINQNTRYADVLKKLEEPRDVSRQYRWELAYDELMAGTTGGMFEDQYGIFQYDRYNEFLDSLRLKYGDADFERARQAQQEKYAEYPEMFQELQKAKELLADYWNVERRVANMFGAQIVNTKFGQRLITKLRKQMRMQNPELERYYQTFYSRTP